MQEKGKKFAHISKDALFIIHSEIDYGRQTFHQKETKFSIWKWDERNTFVDISPKILHLILRVFKKLKVFDKFLIDCGLEYVLMFYGFKEVPNWLNTIS